MKFNSVAYPLFIALVAVALWAIASRRARFWFLLVASYLFYASWGPFYVVLLGTVGVIAQRVGAYAAAAEGTVRSRRAYAGAAALVVVLVVFRTQATLVGLHRGFASVGFGSLLDEAVPLGLSFYVFEAIGYLVEVAKGREKAYSFWNFQLFMGFFPHLVAGPIMRAKELVRQFEEPDGLKPREVGRGIWLIASGLFLKVVLADELAPKLDPWFDGAPDALRSADIVLLGLGFGVQMYLDFSGYSRIAVGSGLLAGARLVENFNYPFAATSPPDFWNRWHISLSRWIRDYVFLAFVGRNRGLGRLCVSALVAMSLCGLWHGFGWKFLIWGAFHGAAIATYHVYRHTIGTRLNDFVGAGGVLRERAFDVVGWLATTVILFPGWIMFRAPTLGKAAQMLAIAATPWRHAGKAMQGNIYLHVGFLFACVLAAPWVDELVTDRAAAAAKRSAFGRLSVDGAAAALVAVLLVFTMLYLGTDHSFIYFQF